MCLETICNVMEKELLNDYKSHDVYLTFLGVLNCLSGFIALALNTIIILSFVIFRKLCKVENVLIFNVCLVDWLIVLMIQLPIGGSLAQVFHLPCKLLKPWGQILNVVSFLSVVCISIDRFTAVFSPYRYATLITLRNVIISMVSIWIAPVTLGVLVYARVICPNVLMMFTSVCCLFFGVVLTVGHMRIFLLIRRIRRQIREDTARFHRDDGNNAATSLPKREITTGMKGMQFTISAIVVVLVCYYPLSIYSLYVVSPSGIEHGGSFASLYVCLSLSVAPASANPILMLFAVTDVRKTVKKLFRIRERPS
eukprot:gene17763-19537_t